MKKIIFPVILIALSVLITQCKKADALTYNTFNYLQFTNWYKDTIDLSFFTRPGLSNIDIPLAFKIIGHLPQQDRSFEVEIDEKATTALPAYYQMPASFVFKKGKVTDTALIRINNHPELLNKSFLLVLTLKSLKEGSTGQTEFLRKVIRFDNQFFRPNWWDWSMEMNYLGAFTEKKARLFIEVTGVSRLDQYSLTEQREIMLSFKQYLIVKKNNNEAVLEEDGTDMLSTIPLLG